MAEYYNYLFRISWPTGCLLIGLYLFILIRLWYKIKYVRRYEWDGWGIFVLVHKIAFWIFIMFVYLIMFFRLYPDWFSQPVVLTGQVQNIDYDLGRQRYFMELKTEDDQKTVNLWVDENSFRQIKLGSRVEVKHLYFRNEVYSCKVFKPDEDARNE